MMLVTFSSSVNELGPIWCILFPVIMTVLAYPGIFSGAVSRSLETHFTVRITAKHSQPKGHSKQRHRAQKRIPKNTKTAEKHISK